MRRGLLSDYFVGVGAKRLAAVDADAASSNQHEVTGSKPLLRILGDRDRKLPRDGGADTRFFATYIWLGAEQEAVAEEARLSWYDSRRNDKSRPAEWRLYYQTNPVTEMMRPGDTLFVARTPEDKLFFIVVPDESTMQYQLIWLFGLEAQPGFVFEPREIGTDTDAELDFAARYILDELGIEPAEPEADRLDAIIEPLGLEFPGRREFSQLARSSMPEVSAADHPDLALVAWMDREEQLFRRLERRIVAAGIKDGFRGPHEGDVDSGFLSFSLSVQGRRKARAGHALENHLEAVFAAQRIRYVRGVATENGNVPDFLFPGQEEYHNRQYPDARLTMLAAKATIKEGWRQVLSEAARISEKHLLTLEPGISENQTDEMHAEKLQLIVPRRLHDTYRLTQQAWLIDVASFISLVRSRQNH